MMAYTGATYTCVGSKYASHLLMVGRFTKTIGFSGHTQSIPITAPRMTIGEFLFSECESVRERECESLRERV